MWTSWGSRSSRTLASATTSGGWWCGRQVRGRPGSCWPEPGTPSSGPGSATRPVGGWHSSCTPTTSRVTTRGCGQAGCGSWKLPGTSRTAGSSCSSTCTATAGTWSSRAGRRSPRPIARDRPPVSARWRTNGGRAAANAGIADSLEPPGGGVMTAYPPITVRQPRTYDIVDDPVLVCGVGTGFEATCAARVRDAHGHQLGQVTIHAGGTGIWGNFQVAGGAGPVAVDDRRPVLPQPEPVAAAVRGQPGLRPRPEPDLPRSGAARSAVI